DTIPQIKAKVIAGTANNVLLDEEVHGPMIRDRGILYAPDFVMNAGGLINVYHELIGYKKENVMAEVKMIYERLLEIFKIADQEKISTQQAAKVFAQNRIETIKNVHSNYIKR
ncbi:MAG: leucine dehydrogenase, partial [Firmicutes bacterium]|nr:leucine dehydrogenase [Bacillota bacterium]